MIVRGDYWFDIVPSRQTGDTVVGKWLHFGATEELHSWLERLDRLVEEGKFPAAKVARKLPGIDPFPDRSCVLCVFTPGDEQSKENARRVLKDEFNIDVTVWKSDEQTRRDWQPGGWLSVEAEVNELRQRFETGEGRTRLRQLAERLQQAIEALEPSRTAEVEASGAATSVRQLVEALRRPDAPEQSIGERVDQIYNLVTQMMARQHAAVPQAALAPATEDADAVFVIMPFAEEHVDTYDAIQRAVTRASSTLRAGRVDEIPGAIQITDEVRKSIRNAWLIICDLTEARPNVYYELGLAHGLVKQVICIARKGTTIHFDVSGLKILYFDTYRSLESQLEEQVQALSNQRR